jgi:hypothetical protein
MTRTPSKLFIDVKAWSRFLFGSLSVPPVTRFNSAAQLATLFRSRKECGEGDSTD